MTQSLTLLARNASRTSVLVDAYLEASADENVSVDPMAFAKSVLLDIAESHGVNGLSVSFLLTPPHYILQLSLAGFGSNFLLNLRFRSFLFLARVRLALKSTYDFIA